MHIDIHGSTKLRMVFVNYSHPCYAHISAVRVRRFADEMVKRGHQVILLTKTLRDDDPGTPVSKLSELIRHHEWDRPLHVDCAPLKKPVLQHLRVQQDLSLRNKLRMLYEFSFHGGMLNGWVREANQYGNVLATTFRPDVTWGTFGCTDTLWICRDISRKSGAAWCIDFKDNWEQFIPMPFRFTLARRLAKADGFTANSIFHGRIAERWTGRQFTTLYSGVDNPVMPPEGIGHASFKKIRSADSGEHGGAARFKCAEALESHPLPHDGHYQGNTLFIGGSIYSEDHFGTLLDGITSWWHTHPAWHRRFEISYAGCDAETVQRIMIHKNVPFVFDIFAHLPHSKYIEYCREAMVNAYIWLPYGFHHKAVELLCAGRPVIVIPGEHQETHDIAQRAGGELLVCRTADDVAMAMGRLTACEVKLEGWQLPAGSGEFSWDSQADFLERVLVNVARNRAANEYRTAPVASNLS